jgi:uncharacterized SAM-dependent methyltransferase
MARELDARIDPAGFRHHAEYNESQSRVESHLVSARDQVVTVAGRRFAFKRDERLHTENSYKYSIDGFQALGRRAGFEPVAAWTDPQQLFSVHYFKAAPSARPVQA